MPDRSVRVTVDMITAQAEAAAARLGGSVRAMAAEVEAAAAGVAGAEAEMAAAAGRAATEQEAAAGRAAAATTASAREQALSAQQLGRLQDAALAENARRTEAAAAAQAAAVKKVSKELVVLGAVGVAAFGLAASKASEFDKTISATGAITTATGSQLNQVRNLALQLGRDTAFSANQAAQGINELAKNGISLPNILHGAAKAAIDLASANDAQLAPSAQLVSNAMDLFGLKASQLPSIANSITGATHSGAGSLQDYAYALENSGAVAKTMGVSFNDLSVAIAELGKNGIRGTMAGTNLKDVLLRLEPRSKEAADLMKQLGIITADGGNKFFDASGKVKSFADIAQVLQDALRGMSKEQQAATLNTLFGLHAIQGASILAAGGAEAFNKFAAAVGRTTVAEAAKTRLDNLSGSVKILKGSLDTALIESGREAEPVLRALADGATKVANGFINLPGPLKAVAVGLTGIGGGVMLLAGTMGLVVPKVRALRTELEAIGPAGAKANAALGVVGKGFTWTAIAVVGATLLDEAVTALYAHSGPAAANTNKLALSLHDMAVNGRASGETARVFGKNLQDLAQDLSDVDHHASILEKLSIWGETQAKYGSKKAASDLKSLDDALTQLVNSGHIAEAQKDYELLDAAVKKNGGSTAELNKHLGNYQQALAAAAQQASTTAYGTGTLSDEAHRLGTNVLTADDALKQFNQELSDFGKPIATDQALMTFNEGLLKLTSTLRGNKNALDETTQAGIDNRRAVEDEINAAYAHAQAIMNEGGSAEDARKSLLDHRDALRAEMIQAGMSAGAVDNLLNQYFKIPDNISTLVQLLGVAQVNANLNGIHNKINDLPTYKAIVVDIQERQHAIEVNPKLNQASGGINIRSFAAGGSVLPNQARIAPPGTLYQWAEPTTKGEAFIPLSSSTRGRSEEILAQVATMFGGAYLPNMGSRSASTAGGGATTAALHPQDRVLLVRAIEAMEGRPVQLVANGRELARTVTLGQRLNARRGT